MGSMKAQTVTLKADDLTQYNKFLADLAAPQNTGVFILKQTKLSQLEITFELDLHWLVQTPPGT